MANINEYLVWRGDLPFNKNYPFNEIDSLILARFSYLVFYKIKMSPKETIESISKKMKDIPNKDFLFNGDKELIENLGNSIRYKDLVVTDYVRKRNKDVEKQFGAVTIHLSNSEMYVSYIGTDNSINGWKEDFNMMFLEDVPCQNEGKSYLENVSQKYNGKRIRIGGHSKGGNVAIFSAIAVGKRIQNKIIKVYNYDGPGFKLELLKKYNVNNIISRVHTYIPQDSVIGLLLYHKEDISTVLSVEKGIMQHDIYSWQVLKNDLIYLENNTESSRLLDGTIKEWFEETTNEQRKIVVDTIFDLLYSTNDESFKDIGSNLAKTLPVILKSYNEISREDKKMISTVINKIIKIYITKANINQERKVKEFFIEKKNEIKDRAKKYKK